MRNRFKNNTPPRRPSWSARRQHLRLPERTSLSVDDISPRAVVATTETQGTLGEPPTLADALRGPYFKRWSRNHLIDLVWGQLDLSNGRSEFDTLVYLPKCTRNGVRQLLTGAFNGLLQVPEAHVCDRFGVRSGVEAFYVE